MQAALQETSDGLPLLLAAGFWQQAWGVRLHTVCAGAFNTGEQAQLQAAVTHHEAEQGTITVNVEAVLSKAGLLEDLQHLEVQAARQAQLHMMLGGCSHSQRTTGGLCCQSRRLCHSLHRARLAHVCSAQPTQSGTMSSAAPACSGLSTAHPSNCMAQAPIAQGTCTCGPGV